MNRPIPEEIVARLSELGELLAGWCEAGRDQSLAEHEAAVLARMRQILPRLLEGVVGAATSGLDARLRRARQACPACRRGWSVVEPLFGEAQDWPGLRRFRSQEGFSTPSPVTRTEGFWLDQSRLGESSGAVEDCRV